MKEQAGIKARHGVIYFHESEHEAEEESMKRKRQHPPAEEATKGAAEQACINLLFVCGVFDSYYRDKTRRDN